MAVNHVKNWSVSDFLLKTNPLTVAGSYAYDWIIDGELEEDLSSIIGGEEDYEEEYEE